MKLSIAETATLLGKSKRQVRYLIDQQRLPATKQGSRWRIDSAALPLDDAERQRLAERNELARRAFEKGLEPAVKAARPKLEGTSDGSKAADGEPAKRSYSVTDLLTFQSGESIYREMEKARGAEDRVCGTLFEALALVARGCHCYHPRDKASRFSEARELAATAVAELLLGGGEGVRNRVLAERIEQELIPKLAGLVAAYEKRGRQSRFEGFGRGGLEPVRR
jgi:excisionase family DNA binding protein